MGSRRSRRPAIFASLALLLAALPGPVFGASPPATSSGSCGGSTMLIDLIAPSDPRLATVITATVASDCSVSVTGPVVVDNDRVGLESPSHLLAASKLPSSVDAGAGILAASVSTKRAVSQSFDPVGIRMTEESLFVRYWWSGEQITDVYPNFRR